MWLVIRNKTDYSLVIPPSSLSLRQRGKFCYGKTAFAVAGVAEGRNAQCHGAGMFLVLGLYSSVLAMQAASGLVIGRAVLLERAYLRGQEGMERL